MEPAPPQGCPSAHVEATRHLGERDQVELGLQSSSEIYSKNGYFNANGTLVHHRNATEAHDIISTTTGAVVRANAVFNSESSFDPIYPDVWYTFTKGGVSPILTKYLVSTGVGVTLKTFGGNLGNLGGSVDNIDNTGRYFVLSIGGVTRVWDKRGAGRTYQRCRCLELNRRTERRELLGQSHGLNRVGARRRCVRAPISPPARMALYRVRKRLEV